MNMNQFQYTAKLRGSNSFDYHLNKLESNHSYICYKTHKEKKSSFEIIGPIKSTSEFTLSEIENITNRRAKEIHLQEPELVSSTSKQIFKAQEAEKAVLSNKMILEVLQTQNDCLISVYFTAEASDDDPELNACIEQYSQRRFISLATTMEMTIDS